MVIRSSRGMSVINWILIGFLLLGLGGWGVTNFSGRHAGSIGSVGGVEIAADDYARGLRSEMQAIAAQTGQAPSAESLRSLGIAQAVQQRLITAAALEAEAREIGLSVSDQRVADQITAAPGFQTGGSFDRTRYADVLRREGLTARIFEHQVRMDEARLLLQRAVTGATAPPEGQVEQTAGWLTETRDLAWTEVTEADLAGPVAEPDDATLEAWWKANPDRFTAPETRHITYAWLTPEMLEATVQLDEAALRALYDERRDEFQQPARRMIDRLVYPDLATAEAARARLDRGEASFDDLVAERGLTRADTDQGEVTEAALGPAGAAVFAATQNGVVGPVETPLGPALISVNAILDPVSIPFEQARADLRAEAAAAKARRDIAEMSADLQDRLAGGAALEQLAEETAMELGRIDWQAEATLEPGSIATYPAFRTRAAAATEKDFPELLELDDGGLFALTLDRVTPPAVIPFAEARAAVLADWTAAETQKRLMALAEERRVEAVAARSIAGARQAAGLGRDSVIEGVPGEVVSRGFALAEPGEVAVVAADGRVFLVGLTAIHEGDPDAPETALVRGAVEQRLTQSLAQDSFNYYAQAVTNAHGLRLDPQAVAAVDAQVR